MKGRIGLKVWLQQATKRGFVLRVRTYKYYKHTHVVCFLEFFSRRFIEKTGIRVALRLRFRANCFHGRWFSSGRGD